MIHSYFNLSCIPSTAIWITKFNKNIEGDTPKEIKPMSTGRMKPFAIDDVVTIGLSVLEDHKCYTKSGNALYDQRPKKAIGCGVYSKQFTINNAWVDIDPKATSAKLARGEKMPSFGIPMIAKFPDNHFCLEVEGRQFNIGFVNQNSIFYFIVEEYTREDEPFVPGKVRWFSPLRGFGSVFGDVVFDYKVHWTGLPKRENGLRYVDSGDTLVWNSKNLANTATNRTSFQKEIKKAELVLA